MNKHLHLSRNTIGFTLIELIVVVAVMGIFASMIVANMGQAQAVARDAQRLEDMRAISQALELFYADNGRYPGNEDNITGSTIDEAGQMIGVGNRIDTLLGKYLETVPVDPLHDAGSGIRPITGALFFYSYDPNHNLDNCTGTLRSVMGVVFGFNYAETYTNLPKETCSGGDLNLDRAIYNRGFLPSNVST